jgi:hypothetical protein
MKEEPKCEQCKKKENLWLSVNPFDPVQNRWLCNDCQFLIFFYKNYVKYLDASTHMCEGKTN